MKVGDITINSTEIKMVHVRYMLFVIQGSTMNSCTPTNWITDENGQFFRNTKPTKINNKEIENLNRPINRKEIKSLIKKNLKEKISRLHGSTGEFCQTFKKE